MALEGVEGKGCGEAEGKEDVRSARRWAASELSARKVYHQQRASLEGWARARSASQGRRSPCSMGALLWEMKMWDLVGNSPRMTRGLPPAPRSGQTQVLWWFPGAAELVGAGGRWQGPTPAATGKANSSEPAAQAEGDPEGGRRPPGIQLKIRMSICSPVHGVYSSLSLFAQ